MKQISELHKAAIVACGLLLVLMWLAHSTTTKRELKEAYKVAGYVSAGTEALLVLGAIL